MTDTGAQRSIRTRWLFFAQVLAHIYATVCGRLPAVLLASAPLASILFTVTYGLAILRGDLSSFPVRQPPGVWNYLTSPLTPALTVMLVVSLTQMFATGARPTRVMFRRPSKIELGLCAAFAILIFLQQQGLSALRASLLEPLLDQYRDSFTLVVVLFSLGQLALTLAIFYFVLRFAPVLAILVNEGRLDFSKAWASLRGRSVAFAFAVLLCFVLEYQFEFYFGSFLRGVQLWIAGERLSSFAAGAALFGGHNFGFDGAVLALVGFVLKSAIVAAAMVRVLRPDDCQQPQQDRSLGVVRQAALGIADSLTAPLRVWFLAFLVALACVSIWAGPSIAQVIDKSWYLRDVTVAWYFLSGFVYWAGWALIVVLAIRFASSGEPAAEDLPVWRAHSNIWLIAFAIAAALGFSETVGSHVLRTQLGLATGDPLVALFLTATARLIFFVALICAAGLALPNALVRDARRRVGLKQLGASGALQFAVVAIICSIFVTQLAQILRWCVRAVESSLVTVDAVTAAAYRSMGPGGLVEAVLVDPLELALRGVLTAAVLMHVHAGLRAARSNP